MTMTKAMECTEQHKMGKDWRQAAQDRDGWGDQPERCLAFLDNRVTDEEKEEVEEEVEEEEDSHAGHSIKLRPVVQCTNKRSHTQ